MLFNSIDFAIFLPVVFALYWFVFNKDLKAQNGFILLASYFFYGWWDWRFLCLIFASTCIDYFVGLSLAREETELKRKRWLLLSFFANLGFLAFFKYFNFFVENFTTAYSFFGGSINHTTLNIILPVGISFYTFQTLSYTIDIYRKKLAPTKDFVAFAAFVSFFPQLVAGPIERATQLLPQFFKARIFDYNFAVSGIRLMIWGFFKKIVIADNAGIIVDGIFETYQSQSYIALILGIVLFAFQIYCDFSGYSDIAIGLSRIFGFKLMTNFKFPYFSSNIREFWTRWHISLSTWFRDYLYIPLGGSRFSKYISLRNVFAVFLVSGLWHGANWTFIMWGLIHGLLFLPFFLLNVKKNNTDLSPLTKGLYILLNFAIVTLAWTYFRADNITIAHDYLFRIFKISSGESFFLKTGTYALITLFAAFGILVLLMVEYLFFNNQKEEVQLPTWALSMLLLLITFTGAFKNQAEFIYFQF